MRSDDGAERRWARRRSGGVIAVVLAVLAGCGGDTGGDQVDDAGGADDRGREIVAEDAASYGGRLVVGVSAETNGWTPQTNQFADAGSLVASSVIEPLAIFDESNTPVPYLAEGWESNEDFTEWTVRLRDGIEFHDGEPLDAAAAIENIETALASPLIGLALSPLVDRVEPVVGDDLAFVIHLARQWSALPRMLANQPGMMVSPRMFEEEALGALHPVGTGPFVFDEWVQGDRFVAVRNEDYWRTTDDGDRLPYLDSIEFRVIVDGAARATALRVGDIDLMYTTRAPDIEAFRVDSSYTIVEDNRSEETFVQLNQAIPPFDDEHARRAVALAVDAVTVAAVLGESIAEPIDQPWAEDDPFYNPDAGYVAYDVEAARAEVDRYREETGEDRLSFTMKGLASVDDAQLLQLLEQMWDAAGIDADLQTVEQTTFQTDLALGNFEASFFRGFADTHLDMNYVFLHSDHARYGEGVSINFTNTTSSEIDELLEETRRTSMDDDEVWHGNYREIARLINEELSYIWLYRTPYALVATPGVGGLNPAREGGFANLEPKWWVGELWLG